MQPIGLFTSIAFATFVTSIACIGAAAFELIGFGNSTSKLATVEWYFPSSVPIRFDPS